MKLTKPTVSTAPLAESRATPARGTPFTVVNAPAMTMVLAFAPGVVSSATALTGPSAPVPIEKVVSMVPSALRRARRFTFEPFTEVNVPTMIMRPSGCTATPLTALFAPTPPMLNVVSSVPM